MTTRRTQRLVRAVAGRVLTRPAIARAQRMCRRILRWDQQLRDAYLAEHAEPKLHIGGGWHRLEGWLNTDIDLVPNVMLMDAMERFPFADDTIQFVYTEHMIEHIPREKATVMLRECYRVLRRDGVIRVTTPDLAAILGLYNTTLSDTQRHYLSWFCETFLPREPLPNAVSVVNAQLRMWGHQFLYDESTLGAALRDAGFRSVHRRRLGESDYAALRDLENTERYPEGLLDFESVALEAVK